MAAVSPVGNAIYVNQLSPIVSSHIANVQNASQFQAALAGQLFAQQNHNKVATVGETEQDHEIDEKEQHSPEWHEEQKKRKKKEENQTDEEASASSSEHILDLKA